MTESEQSQNGADRTDVVESTLPEFDKSAWRAGQDEPDRVEWYYRGVPCLLRRGPMGNWCGYAAVVDASHPWRDRGRAEDQADVHGGITYAEPCNHDIGVCHVPKPGESDHVFWLGFDCGHAWDFMPKIDLDLRAAGIRDSERPFALVEEHTDGLPSMDVYRDKDYAMRETELLAAQILAAGGEAHG
jgi:hypothetical protein